MPINFSNHLIQEKEIITDHHQEELKLKWKQASFSKHFDLKRIAAHIFIIPPGYRSSEPHAEKTEEEFVYIISGEIDLWFNGRIKRLIKGDCIGFPAGTGDGHCFINNSNAECKIFVSGDRTKKDNQYYFHLDPSLKSECGDSWWDGVPHVELGAHDGWPGDYEKNLRDDSIETLNAFSNIKEASFSYPGSNETFGDGLCLSRHFNLTNIAIWFERLAPGKRSSWPHAHRTEEEFVFVLEGSLHLWLDGAERRTTSGYGIDFKAGSRVAHTLINKSDKVSYYLCVGECAPDGDQIFYPEHPARNDDMRTKGLLWE